ncbi:MAG TPA: RecX family transcriptional regulator [Acetobacteraceae bacterium]|nr:RecX family transcriptional regulator [Acetobacteraceae bacterium]
MRSPPADPPATPRPTGSPTRTPAGAPPDAARLHEAALRHLARFAATEAGLLRVLERRIERWARAAEAEGQPADTVTTAAGAARQAARQVVSRLAQAGAVDDRAFAAGRARSLTRAGRSRRAIGAHLAAKGVDPALAVAALPEDTERELAAALIHARRRRIGPFRRSPPDAEGRLKELAAMARAGFESSVARAALGLDPAEAEAIIIHARQAL